MTNKILMYGMLLIAYLLGSLAVGRWAEKKGRSWGIWVFAAFFLSPLLAAIFLRGYPSVRPGTAKFLQW